MNNTSGYTVALGLTWLLAEMSKGKVYRPGVAQRVGRVIAALERGEWSAAYPGLTQYPFYRRLGGPQRQSGQDLIPDHPARNQSLHRLSYLAHSRNKYQEYFLECKDGQSIGLTTVAHSLACFLEV